MNNNNAKFLGLVRQKALEKTNLSLTQLGPPSLLRWDMSSESLHVTVAHYVRLEK